MQVRQVVTGHDAKGRAVFGRDEQVEDAHLTWRARLLWSADEPATTERGTIRRRPTFPPVGGIRFIMQTYSPESSGCTEPTPECT